MAAIPHDNRIVEHLPPLICMQQSQTAGLDDQCRPYTAAKLDDKATAFPCKHLCDGFFIFKNISQDTTSDRLANELGFVHGRWIEH